MQVRWNSSLSPPFATTNGVHQGGVVLDGCFVGALGYADDVALLAPSPSALHIMLRFCENFASMHGLTFNASKTQLINFGTQQFHTCSALIYFYDNQLSFLMLLSILVII